MRVEKAQGRHVADAALKRGLLSILDLFSRLIIAVEKMAYLQEHPSGALSHVSALAGDVEHVSGRTLEDSEVLETHCRMLLALEVHVRWTAHTWLADSGTQHYAQLMMAAIALQREATASTAGQGLKTFFAERTGADVV